jgi:hypothetical protein
MTVATEKKYKAHTVYKLADGTRVPGVTTITGQIGWNKDVLVRWANKMGLQGIDTIKYVDDKADIGTLAHRMVECHLTGEELDSSDYSKNQIDKAENCLISFFEWEKVHKISVIHHELELVSEKLGFGGKLDLHSIIDSIAEIDDLKTGSGIYAEHYVQVAGYCILADENNIPYNQARIINIPRTNDERFDQQVVKNLDLYKQIFLRLLDIYKLKKQIDKPDEFDEFIDSENKKARRK